MPPLLREEKRVAVAALGEAYSLVQKMIVDVKKELLEHGVRVGRLGIKLESLENPLTVDKIVEMTGM